MLRVFYDTTVAEAVTIHANASEVLYVQDKTASPLNQMMEDARQWNEGYKGIGDTLRGTGIDIGSSELLFPICMYIFVSILLAHESATFTGQDALEEMREDAW